MKLANQKTEINNINIGEIIKEGLNNSVVKNFCTQGKNKSLEEIKNAQREFSRFVGFCILFRSTKDIEKYMILKNKNEQIAFLKNKIEKQLKISEEKLEQKKEKIIQYAYLNFKKYGYVFHAANSLSIKTKMNTGLSNNINIEQQKELLYIESIYRKYEPNSLYSPLGYAITDILENKTGWFFDGIPIHSTRYANSPQWFKYLCGKSYVYFDDIPEERRNGYANKDFITSLEAIMWLIKSKNMSLKDSKEIFLFFKKCWEIYKDTTPCLIFVPVEEVGINEEIKMEQYLSNEGMELLFNDIISGQVSSIKNYCCKKFISPDKLSYVDLSPILPKFKIERVLVKKSNLNKSNSPKIQDDGEER